MHTSNSLDPAVTWHSSGSLVDLIDVIQDFPGPNSKLLQITFSRAAIR